MTQVLLAHANGPPLSTSRRLDDPTMDVFRRAFVAYLEAPGDPRTMPGMGRSRIEEYGGLFYVVCRPDDPELPPVAVFRLFNDLSLKGLNRYPRAIRDEIETTEAALVRRTKRGKS